MISLDVLSKFSFFQKEQPRRLKFKVGNTVQLIESGRPMIVASIIHGRKMTEPLFLCKWIDEFGKNATNFFLENELDQNSSAPEALSSGRDTLVAQNT